MLPPLVGRGTECPRRGVPVHLREGSLPKGRDCPCRLGAGGRARVEPDRLCRTRLFAAMSASPITIGLPCRMEKQNSYSALRGGGTNVDL